MNMYCKKCGKLLNQGEVICTNCGTSNDINNVGNSNNFNVPNQFNVNTNNQNNISNGGNVNSNQMLNNGVDPFAAFNQNFASTTMNNTNNVNNSDNYNNFNNQNVNQTNMSNGFENSGFNNSVTQQNVDNGMGNINFTNLNNNLKNNVGGYNNQNNQNNQNFNSSNNNSSFGNKNLNYFSNNKNKVVFLILGVIIVIIVIFVSMFLYTSLTSKKMVCKSSYGDFTLKYKGSKIIDYTASGTFGEQIDFDVDEQNKNAKELGMDEYLNTFSTIFISATDGTCTIDGKAVTADAEADSDVLDGEVWDKENDSKIIGNSDYGYVKVPKNWVEFKDVNGNDMVQYTYAGVYIVSLYAYDGSQYSAKDYATAYETEIKKDENVVSAYLASYTDNLNDSYDANRVTVDYSDNTKMYAYWFKAEDGKVHYIAIEGPEELDGKSFYDFIRIADTFTLTK